MKHAPLITRRWLPLMLCSLLTPFAAQAQSFRCGNDLANVGDSKSSVLNKCGAPVLKDSYCKPVPPVETGAASGTVVNVQACINVDDWTYNPGYGQFMTTLRFESSVLKSIHYGERVK